MVKISESTIGRLSHYYRFLEEMEENGIINISSKKLAERGNITPAKVRKDLSYFGNFGRRGLGYNVIDLKKSIIQILGITERCNLLLVGAGNLGAALFSFREFKKASLHIVAILEKNPAKIGRYWEDVLIRDIRDLQEVIDTMKIDIAVLAVPVKSAFLVSEQLILAGVKTILNFAPIKLPHHEGVIIRDVNLTIEFESLTYLLRKQSNIPRKQKFY